jgi:hypothetical protein
MDTLPIVTPGNLPAQNQTQTGEPLEKSPLKQVTESLAAMDFKAVVDNATPEQLEYMAKIYATQKIQAAFNGKADRAAIDYQGEKETFLENSGHIHSEHTERAYRNALEGTIDSHKHRVNSLEAFCREKNISVLELTPALADDFI